MRYDPFSNTYNMGWRGRPNFTYGGNQQAMGPNPRVNHPPRFFQPRQQQAYQHQQSSGPTLDEIVKTLTSSTLQFQQETTTSIKNLEIQVSQLANSVGRIENQGLGKLPPQTVTNPKENVSAITLRGE